MKTFIPDFTRENIYVNELPPWSKVILEKEDPNSPSDDQEILL
jgi:hypothetical protein